MSNCFYIILILVIICSCLTARAMEVPYPNYFPNFYFVYEVKEGDNLTTIARTFGVSIQGLMWANGIQKGDFIHAGEELIIPQKLIQEVPALNSRLKPQTEPQLNLDIDMFPISYQQPLPQVDISPDKVILYQVRRGDTLYDLAREFNTTVSFLQALNNLEQPTIRIGQRIYLPIHNLTPRQALARTITTEDLELIARTIHAEARGEPFIGQVAVGVVIINRVLDPSFPNTFHGVVYQPRQFSCVIDGQIGLIPNQIAYDAAREALQGTDPTRGALYYYNPQIATDTHWLKTRDITVIIGNHVFLK